MILGAKLKIIFESYNKQQFFILQQLVICRIRQSFGNAPHLQFGKQALLVRLDGAQRQPDASVACHQYGGQRVVYQLFLLAVYQVEDLLTSGK